jgi:hypothetical protein
MPAFGLAAATAMRDVDATLDLARDRLVAVT